MLLTFWFVPALEPPVSLYLIALIREINLLVTWHQSRGATARDLACSQCFLSPADSLQLNSSSLPPLQHHLIVTYGSNAIITIEIDLFTEPRDTVRITTAIKRCSPRPCRKSFLPHTPSPAESSDSSPPQVFTWLVSLYIRAQGIYGGYN